MPDNKCSRRWTHTNSCPVTASRLCMQNSAGIFMIDKIKINRYVPVQSDTQYDLINSLARYTTYTWPAWPSRYRISTDTRYRVSGYLNWYFER